MSKKADNRLYNAERKAQAELIKRDLDRDRLITQLYQESYDRLQAQIDKFYLGYAGREGLTKQEAMKRASEFDVTKFAEKARKAVKEKDFSHKTNSWLRVYNLKMKVSRLELLKAELGLEINSLTSNLEEVFDKARRSEYLAEFKRQAGILGISSSGATKRLESILNADFYGQSFSSRVWGKTGLQPLLQRDVFASLNRIYTDMNGYQKEMKLLANKYGTSEYNAKRLIKTEIARINSDTDHAMLKDNGFTHMIFVAESGACDICKPLDNTAVPIDKVEKGVNMFPMHPNCRCSAYGHIEMKYKDGRSTLDEFEKWSESEDNIILEQTGENNKKSSSTRSITGEKQKLLSFEDDEIFEAQDTDDIDAFFNEQPKYKKWYNGLTEEEKHAIYSYTTSDYHDFNNIKRYGFDKALKLKKDFWLEEQGEADLEFALEEVRKTKNKIPILEKALSDFAPEKSFKAFRGTGSVSALGEDLGYMDLEVGQKLTLDKSFTSFSLDKNYATEFARDGDGANVLFEVTVKKGQKTGAYIAELADFNPEKEYLMKPNLKYNIISKTETDDGLLVYGLEVLENGS
jgi:putative head morphogenesis protein|uniref:Minor capsid protein n=1 Tax=Siphoviridae sp. ctOow3 TaxID=2826315 RepID=A0A8S5QZX4_9CAUD|nr:MAG TPA: minor capsid protein [Siphoviridae sp. ctOow3]